MVIGTEVKLGAQGGGSLIKGFEPTPDVACCLERYGHEELVVCNDERVGMKAVIAIHDTTLGPACGGVRIRPYGTENEAIIDALRLSRAMTYKAAAAVLPLGGGKAVIMADPNVGNIEGKNEALMRAFGRFVETLDGRYLTAPDVGSTTLDMEHVQQETDFVVGLPAAMGGSGDSAIMTGLGVYWGMKACVKEVWGSDSLRGKTVALQGFGKVAAHTAEHLSKEGARVLVGDISEESLTRARDMRLEIVQPDDIYDVECDIFCPCALGGVLNGDTIPRLRCQIVAGGANNQLLTDSDGEALHRRGILYAPDYIINAGGLINVSAEIGIRYNAERAREKTEQIYDTMGRVIAISKREGIPTSRAADRLAERRLASLQGINRNRRQWHLNGRSWRAATRSPEHDEGSLVGSITSSPEFTKVRSGA